MLDNSKAVFRLEALRALPFVLVYKYKTVAFSAKGVLADARTAIHIMSMTCMQGIRHHYSISSAIFGIIVVFCINNIYKVRGREP